MTRASLASLKAPNFSYPENTAQGSVLLGLLCGVVYLVWVCPGIYWRDAGELSGHAAGGYLHGCLPQFVLEELAAVVEYRLVTHHIGVESGTILQIGVWELRVRK